MVVGPVAVDAGRQAVDAACDEQDLERVERARGRSSAPTVRSRDSLGGPKQLGDLRHIERRGAEFAKRTPPPQRFLDRRHALGARLGKQDRDGLHADHRRLLPRPAGQRRDEPERLPASHRVNPSR
jgi:hypothetical protein